MPHSIKTMHLHSKHMHTGGEEGREREKERERERLTLNLRFSNSDTMKCAMSDDKT